MSPVAKRRGRGHTGRALAAAIVGVVVALGTAFLVAGLASRGDVQVRLGDDRFNAGSARGLLDDIYERGAPLAFQDPATFRRPIWVDNLGDDPTEGWIAHLALVPEDPDCEVNWNAERDRYVACDGETTYPRSGDGLRQFPVEVDDGRVFVDLQDRDDAADP